MKRLSIVVFLALVTTCCALSPKTKTQPFLGEYDYAVTSVLGVSVVCGFAVRRPCGMSLSDCTDGVRYECVNEVAVVDMRKMIRIPPKPKSEGI